MVRNGELTGNEFQRHFQSNSCKRQKMVGKKSCFVRQYRSMIDGREDWTLQTQRHRRLWFIEVVHLSLITVESIKQLILVSVCVFTSSSMTYMGDRYRFLTTTLIRYDFDDIQPSHIRSLSRCFSVTQLAVLLGQGRGPII